jgi:hypothetical protein
MQFVFFELIERYVIVATGFNLLFGLCRSSVLDLLSVACCFDLPYMMLCLHP